jgi:hypothetical protein
MPSRRLTRYRWPVELTGRYSVRPSVTPRTTAWRKVIPCPSTAPRAAVHKPKIQSTTSTAILTGYI